MAPSGGGGSRGAAARFRCTVMLLGLSGCGKSSVINALLGEPACATSAFGACTKKVRASLPAFENRAALTAK